MSRFSTLSLEQAFKSNYNVSKKNVVNPTSNSTKRGGYNKNRHSNLTQGKGWKNNSKCINFNGNANYKFQWIICKRNGHESKIVILNVKCKVLIIQEEIASIEISKKIIKLTTLKKQKKIK